MSGISLKTYGTRKRPAWRREWGCPRTKNRTPWCFNLCTPDEGKGECGRIQPYSLLGRTDGAILRHRARGELRSAN